MLSQQLEVFLTTVECGSFSKAARRLLVTPASVMKHMNTLEARLGLKLLERGSHGIELTAAGRSLYRDGKKLMQQSCPIRTFRVDLAFPSIAFLLQERCPCSRFLQLLN